MGIKLIFLMSLIFLSGCRDVFPVSDLYRINATEKICEVYKINSDKVTFKFDHELPFENCPANVFGFEEQDAGEVASFFRRMKRKYK